MPPGTSHIVGELIDGRYRIEGLLARGGMGAVYRAQQVNLGRPIAVKFLEPEHGTPISMQEYRERFFLEAATAARLNHPNAVSIHDYGQWRGMLYIAMELIEGSTLVAAIRHAAPMSEARVVHIAKQICGPLHEAHGLGIVHRDLKPGNVMLLDTSTTTDFVKVLDFGLAKRVHAAKDITQPGMFLGSPNYVSPEQIKGEPLDGRADIYALGVIMWEMLSGRPPFARGSQAETVMARLSAPPPPLPTCINPQLRTIIKDCLAIDPEKRYRTVAALLEELNRIHIPSRPVEAATRLLRPSVVKRRRYRARVSPWDTFWLLVGFLSLLAAAIWTFALDY